MGIIEDIKMAKMLVEEYKHSADDVAMKPKSVSAMTKIMEPQIIRDFKDFVWEEFRDKAENMLKMSLIAIATGDPKKIDKNAADDVKGMIMNQIEAYEAQELDAHYDNIVIHRTEIANYEKKSGKCIITIQSAVEYTFYVTDKAGKIKKGRKDRKTQTKYNMELMYIQDQEKAGEVNAIGVACPFCGAPITSLGQMVCEYCGAESAPINIKVWSLHNLYEVDYNHV